MREFALIFILAGFLYLTLLRPWVGVLALAVVGILHPQGYVGGAASQWPVYKLMVIGLVVSLVLSAQTRSPAFLKERLGLFRDWRIIALGLLWLLFLNSTWHSLVPSVSWVKFFEISKVLIVSLFALLLLDTRSKVEWFLFTVAVCVGLVAVKGGYWALMTGSVDRVYGPPGSQFSDNNHFAVLAVMGLPLLALLFRRAPSLSLRLVLGLVLGVSVLAVLTSWSRGALLSLGVTLALLLVLTDRRLALVPLLGVALVLGFDLLPEEWFLRMETITDYEQEGSAQGRLAVWSQGLEFALRFPLTGAGPDGWVWTAARDWHSSYVEILAEHGFPALGIWVAIFLGTLLSLARCFFRLGRPGGDACGAVFVALVAYGVGAAFLGLAYWDLYYQLVVVSVVLTRQPGAGLGERDGSASVLPARG